MTVGTQQSKPVMTARPPMRRSDADTMRDLEMVNAITEAPARAAAQSVGEAATKVEQSLEPITVATETPTKGRAAKPETGMPWESVEGKGVVSFNFKLPSKLSAKLKYLGETTYGESMTSIVTSALEQRVEKMLKERKLI